MSTTKTTVIAAFVIVLTFAAGFIGGAATHHLMASRRSSLPPLAARAIVHHLDSRLDLTDAQRREIEAIIASHHQQMRSGLNQVSTEIARVLTPEQRVKFEKMRLRLERAHGRHFPPAR